MILVLAEVVKNTKSVVGDNMITSLNKEIAESEIAKWTEIIRRENRRLVKLNNYLRKQIKERENDECRRNNQTS